MSDDHSQGPKSRQQQDGARGEPRREAPGGEQDGDQDGERVAALEAEVARLRGELDARRLDEMAAADSIDPNDVAVVHGLARHSRSRAIIIALAMAALALTGILLVTLTLSGVIEPFSKRAAEAIAPFDEEAARPDPETPPAAKPGQSGADDDAPRAPGL